VNVVAAPEFMLNPLEAYLTLSEAHRGRIYIIASVLIGTIAYFDWLVVDVSLGFLYVLPILMVSATLRGWQLVVLAFCCGLLREWFGPVHQDPGVALRVCIGTAGFALAGHFVSLLDRQRRAVLQHLRERERQFELRVQAERQLQVVIETSPLGILTIDSDGRVLLANTSAQHLLRLDFVPLPGQDILAYLPILKGFLNIRHSAPSVRTVVESRGQRADGEAFLAHVWLSTFANGSGRCLAAFIWDASENLRDREGTGLDSMMATSRVLIGAISHEIRNLAAAALATYRELGTTFAASQQEAFRALGAVIQAVENIAASGLKLASHSSKAVADLGMVLDEARVLIDATVRDSGGATEWTIPDRLPLVEADHQSLLQALLNLARNSDTAMQGACTRLLRIEVTRDPGVVLIRFRDSGPGVANPAALFRPFQPGATATGLGLYVSRAVLRSYGGDLCYEPSPAGGCFAVQLLPVADAGKAEIA
jgi:two-component system sensor kinase FixL